jgi:type III restriction enzyme
VNIFGIPFRFLPHESSDEGNGDGRTPKTAIEPVPEKKNYEITFPNVIRIDHTYKPSLEIDVHKTKVLSLNAMNTRLTAELAPVVDAKADLTKLTEIDLEKLDKHLRLQKIIFETARDVFDMINSTWKHKGTKEYLLAQIIRIVEQFLKSDRIEINPPLFNQNSLRRRIMFILNMNRIVQHLWEDIRFTNTEKTVPVFDKDKPIKATGDMRTWYTSRPCQPTKKSHINHCVYDSTWEASESYELDRNTNVEAWVKNDHLGFEIVYVYDGVIRKYYPDFIIRLRSDRYMILETKGQDSQQDKTKRQFLEEWVKAVNQHGGFGLWQWAVSTDPKDIKGILEIF